MRVLVTGGQGWIGRATCRALNRAEHKYTLFDQSSDSDVRNAEDVSLAVSKVDHVIHLAGVLGTHELFNRPHEAVEVNVLGSLNVTKACSERGVGLTQITTPAVNPSVYAATRGCAMDITRAYVEAGRLQANFVRAYNTYGPGQEYGGDHPQKIVPTFATKGWLGEPIPVWGNGMLWVDLVHVSDVARMLVAAIPLAYTHPGQVFDAGTGYRQTVLAVAERIIELTGNRTKVEHMPPRPGERKISTRRDYASGQEGWDLLGGWHPVFDHYQFIETVESYKP